MSIARMGLFLFGVLCFVSFWFGIVVVVIEEMETKGKADVKTEAN